MITHSKTLSNWRTFHVPNTIMKTWPPVEESPASSSGIYEYVIMSFLLKLSIKKAELQCLLKKSFFSFFILDITRETSSLLFTCLTLSPLSPDPLQLQNEAANLCLTSKCFCDKKIWMYEGYSLWPLLDSCVTFIWKSDGLYLNFCKIYFSIFVEKEQ